MEIQIPTLLRIKPDAIYKLGKYLRKAGFLKIALFYGEGIQELVGKTVSISLDSSEVQAIHTEIIGNNQIDEVFKSTFSIPRGAQAIVAVGGGMVIDYSKYIAFLSDLPIISLPTAVSNDGFASPVASLYVQGKRKSLKARIPYGVIMDTEVIRSSPPRFTFSGIGDMISKYSAIADWKLSYHQTGEAVNDFAVMTSLMSVDNLVNFPRRDPKDLEFLRLLCGALVMSGVAMEMTGSSRPASGSEHLISHAYDKVAAKPSLHGLQVGLATLATTWLQDHPKRPFLLQWLEDTGFLAFIEQNPLDRASFLQAIRLAPTIKEGYHTILSDPANVERLGNEVGSNPFYNRFLR